MAIPGFRLGIYVFKGAEMELSRRLREALGPDRAPAAVVGCNWGIHEPPTGFPHRGR